VTAPRRDPLGVQPPPVHGDAKPNFTDRERSRRVEAVAPFFKTNFIEHEPQTEVVEQLLSYLKSVQPLIGGPIDGRRLSEHSNAGKSRMVEQLVLTAAQRRAEEGLQPNPYEIICLELDKTTSVATFFRQVLRLMGDEYWDDPRAKLDQLEDRLCHFARKLDVQGLVGDEVQHLDRKTNNATQVTDRLKTFLNRGILPLILIGDEDADKFFDKNPKFASRLGTPLTLRPLDVRNSVHERNLFRSFCDRLDRSLVQAGIMDELSGLAKPGIRSQLASVSDGHIGRVCRIVCEGAQHALRRGSPVIERYDFSIATREFAMRLKWISRDPFSSPNAV
jgi:hypothetical protein